MTHDYSLAHLTALSLTPPQLIDVAARTGYRYVGLRMTRVTPDEVLYDLGRDRALMRETKARLADTGVAVHDAELFRMDPSLGPDDFLAELDATAELGARHIIAQLPDPDRERAIARFARLCDLAQSRDIFVSLEFPHWTETGNLAEAARVVRAVNRSNAGILVDMLHFGRSDSSLEQLSALPRDWFRFAHVCDAAKEVPPTMAGIIRTARDERLFPGEGGIDVREHPVVTAVGPPVRAGDSASRADEGGRARGSRSSRPARREKPSRDRRRWQRPRPAASRSHPRSGSCPLTSDRANAKRQIDAHCAHRLSDRIVQGVVHLQPVVRPAGIDAVVVPMGVKGDDYPGVLESVFKFTNIRGALVTMPHKVTTVGLVDECTTTVEDRGFVQRRPEAARRHAPGRHVRRRRLHARGSAQRLHSGGRAVPRGRQPAASARRSRPRLPRTAWRRSRSTTRIPRRCGTSPRD